MTLTAQGKALEDGGDGQMIKIQNPKSMRTVEGRVTGMGEVTVGAPQAPIQTAAVPAVRKSVPR
jgi:flagella basal body P-ring formation protein FlgA